LVATTERQEPLPEPPAPGVSTSEIQDAKRKRIILALCCVAQFMVILDLSIVNVALPSIQVGLHFSSADLQWVVNAYAIVFAGFLMLAGRAADVVGRIAGRRAGADEHGPDHRPRRSGTRRGNDGRVLAGDHHFDVRRRT
jgi:hypothetical protein